MDYETEYIKVRNFKAFHNKSKEEIIARLKEIHARKEKEKSTLDINAIFSDKAEKIKAENLVKRYLKDYTIETISDKNTLKTLVYYEILLFRLQAILNALHKEKRAAPLNLIEEMNRVVDKITQLKEALGISKSDISRNETFNAFQLLKKKAEKWRKENQGSRTMNCPHCGQMILLKIRIEAWDAVKHPFFKDRILTNVHLLKLYRKNKITKNDVAQILECSEDYIDWLFEKAKVHA